MKSFVHYILALVASVMLPGCANPNLQLVSVNFYGDGGRSNNCGLVPQRIPCQTGYPRNNGSYPNYGQTAYNGYNQLYPANNYNGYVQPVFNPYGGGEEIITITNHCTGRVVWRGCAREMPLCYKEGYRKHQRGFN